MERILVVDDEELQLSQTARRLEGEGFEVVRARTAGAALSELREHPISLVLSDLLMPGMNGIELSRMIRSRHPSVPIVLTSEYPLSQRQLDRLALTDVSFVPKACEATRLIAQLRARLSVQRNTRVPQA